MPCIREDVYSVEQCNVEGEEGILSWWSGGGKGMLSCGLVGRGREGEVMLICATMEWGGGGYVNGGVGGGMGRVC